MTFQDKFYTTYLQVQCLLYLHCSYISVRQDNLLPRQASKEHADCKPNAVNEHRITSKGKGGGEEIHFFFFWPRLPHAEISGPGIEPNHTATMTPAVAKTVLGP